MKFNLVIILLLGLLAFEVIARTKVSRRNRLEEGEEEEEGAEEEEEGGEEEGGEEEEEGKAGETGDDKGISEDSLMEYRILGKGTFSVHNGQLNKDDKLSLRGRFVQFPNYCKA